MNFLFRDIFRSATQLSGLAVTAKGIQLVMYQNRALVAVKLERRQCDIREDVDSMNKD